MSVSTITWSPTSQWGASVAATWVDSPIDPNNPPNPLDGVGVPLSNATLPNAFAGMIFDANLDQVLRFTTVRGLQRILDGPILLALRLNLQFAGSILDGGPDNQVEVGIVPDGAPANYSNVLLPWSRGEQSLGIFPLAGLPAFPGTAIPYTFVLSAASVTLIRALVTSRANWTGRVAFSFRAAGANSVDLYNFVGGEIAAVTSQESVWFSGIAGGPGGKVRAVRDGRYGMPAFSNELVRDGDDPGLFVRPFDSDSEDEEQTYRPRPGEGTVDDEIPDL